MSFDTPITTDDDGTLRGPLRSPAQMLGDQEYGGHTSVHDDATAAKLGLAGAPIEGPTHFSQFDPLAVAHFGGAAAGRTWFERGCISAHFLNMVVEGEQVHATLAPSGADRARIEAFKADGTPVLVGTATLGEARTELDDRRERFTGDAGALHIVDQLELGMTIAEPEPVTLEFDEHNGNLYPFTLADKLARITEASTWYAPDGDSPWGRPIVPTEMLSVLTHKRGVGFAVRGPAVGLFIDLEVRCLAGPVFVGQPYRLVHTVVGIGQSKRVESYWTETTLTDAETNTHVATVLLHQGVFKASYAGYPTTDAPASGD